jgi:type IV pilus assembly protein PilV
MPISRRPRHAQSGSFLLEALIGILIFSFGILGIVGLQAQAIRFTNDSQYRGEAIYLANTLLASMWADDRATLKTKYEGASGTGGAGYTTWYNTFKTGTTALPGAAANPPIVVVDSAVAGAVQAPSTTSNAVQVTVFWQLPGEAENGQAPHRYVTSGLIARN